MSAAHRLHVFEAHGYVDVWLDTEVDDRDGICLGSDANRRAALMQAKVELEHALDRVEAHLQRIDSPHAKSRSSWEGDEKTDTPVDGGA